MNTIKIRTTQNVEVEYPMASLGDRIIAHLIDSVVYFIWAMLVALALNKTGMNEKFLFFVVIVIPIMFYHLLCEVFFNGQSVGKRARDIRVIKLSGEAPSIGDYLLRWMFRLIDTGVSTGVVAIVCIASSQKGQRLGDMAAGTCVIKERAVRDRERMNITVEKNYEIRFPEVSLLSDKDVALIRKLLYKAQQHNNYELLEAMAKRVKETTGIRTDMAEWDFLQTVVKDHYQYTHGNVLI